MYRSMLLVAVGALLASCGSGKPNSDDVCNDLVNSAADLQVKGKPCNESISPPSDVAMFCENLAMCTPDGLQSYQKVIQCYRDLPMCDPAQKMAWETRLSGCGAYAPKQQQCPGV